LSGLDTRLDPRVDWAVRAAFRPHRLDSETGRLVRSSATELKGTITIRDGTIEVAVAHLQLTSGYQCFGGSIFRFSRFEVLFDWCLRTSGISNFCGFER